MKKILFFMVFIMISFIINAQPYFTTLNHNLSNPNDIHTLVKQTQKNKYLENSDQQLILTKLNNNLYRFYLTADSYGGGYSVNDLNNCYISDLDFLGDSVYYCGSRTGLGFIASVHIMDLFWYNYNNPNGTDLPITLRLFFNTDTIRKIKSYYDLNQNIIKIEGIGTGAKKDYYTPNALTFDCFIDYTIDVNLSTETPIIMVGDTNEHFHDINITDNYVYTVGHKNFDNNLVVHIFDKYNIIVGQDQIEYICDANPIVEWLDNFKTEPLLQDTIAVSSVFLTDKDNGIYETGILKIDLQTFDMSNISLFDAVTKTVLKINDMAYFKTNNSLLVLKEKVYGISSISDATFDIDMNDHPVLSAYSSNYVGIKKYKTFRYSSIERFSYDHFSLVGTNNLNVLNIYSKDLYNDEPDENCEPVVPFNVRLIKALPYINYSALIVANNNNVQHTFLPTDNYIYHDNDIYCENQMASYKSTTKEEIFIGVNLFPNPAKDYFEITSDKDIISLEIYNLSGIKLHNQLVGSKKVNVATKDYNKGLYIVKIYTKEEIITKKLIIE